MRCWSGRGASVPGATLHHTSLSPLVSSWMGFEDSWTASFELIKASEAHEEGLWVPEKGLQGLRNGVHGTDQGVQGTDGGSQGTLRGGLEDSWTGLWNTWTPSRELRKGLSILRKGLWEPWEGFRDLLDGSCGPWVGQRGWEVPIGGASGSCRKKFTGIGNRW